MFSILNRALSRIITSFGNKFCLKKRSRLIKALDNRFCIKFMQLEIGLFKLFWNVYQKDNTHINRKSDTPGNFGCAKGDEKSELFSQETYHSQIFRYETLKSPLLKKKLSVSLLPHFV